MRLKKNSGITFWITGLSGSGKTTIAEKIKSKIFKKYGPTLTISGDNLREYFQYNKFSKQQRLNYAMNYGKFCKKITEQNINIIISTVSMFDKVRNWNRKNISNYLEIYIEADIDELIKQKKKFFYKKKYKNIVGKNLKAELPKKPDIKIKNNFTKSTNFLSEQIIKNIFRILKK